MYLEDQEQFRNTARFWTETYAIVRSSVDEAVQRLVDMGFAAVRPPSPGTLDAYMDSYTTGDCRTRPSRRSRRRRATRTRPSRSS